MLCKTRCAARSKVCSMPCLTILSRFKRGLRKKGDEKQEKVKARPRPDRGDGGVYLMWCHKSQIIYRIRLDETRNQNQISRTRLVLFFY